jgi:putative ABC transport system permease protein
VHAAREPSAIANSVGSALAVLLGALALVLLGLGRYGVTSDAVARRRAELGIRMTLGATTAAFVRLVVSRVLLVVVIGVAAGATARMWATRFVASLLYGLPPHDPATLVAAAGILAVTAIVAHSCLRSARRGSIRPRFCARASVGSE